MEQRLRPSEQEQRAARDARRAVLAAVMLVFVIATSLSDGGLVPNADPNGAPPRTRAAEGSHEGDLRTGLILITPAFGNICEHRLIDNETWRVRPNGTIQCDAAVAWHRQRNGEHTSQSRIEAIRDGFVSKR